MTDARNTPGIDAGFDLLARIGTDDEVANRYPDGTVIVPSDAPNVAVLVQEAVAEERPVAIVMPDGSDMMWRPRDAAPWFGLLLIVGLLLVRWSKKADDRPTFVPDGWVAEFHAPDRTLAAA